MQQVIRFLWLAFFMTLTVSCASPASLPGPTSAEETELIQPGDQIDGYLITTGKGDEETYTRHLDGAKEGHASRAFITIPWGKHFSPSIGISDDTHSDKLDANWAGMQYEMYINDLPVNLPAFGYVDVDHPTQGRVRHWNVVVIADHSGTITIRDEGEFQGKSLAFTTIYTILPQVTAIQTGLQAMTSPQTRLQFLFYLPQEFGKDPQRKWGVILYLHGAGGKGSDLDLLKKEPFIERLMPQSDFPFIVIAPQVDGESEGWSTDEVAVSLLALLDEVRSTYPFCPKRVYLTGPGAGGSGVWEIAIRYPERFAALVPVEGYFGSPATVPESICDLKDVPVWAFHGENDAQVPLADQQVLVHALEACGGKVQFTLYPQGGHDLENQAYSEPALYDWLQAQSRN